MICQLNVNISVISMFKYLSSLFEFRWIELNKAILRVNVGQIREKD